MKPLNAFHLKIIALLTMLIDHWGYLYFPKVLELRIIGRIAFPLFAFMLVQGYFHTHNITKYLSRLFLWALIAEVPFDWYHFGMISCAKSQNILFTLFVGLLGISFFQQKIHFAYKIAIGAFLCGFAQYINLEYGAYGVLMIFCFYLFRNKKHWRFLSVCLLSVLATFFTYFLQIFCLLAFVPIELYNGKQGIKTGQIYYTFYPLHLFLLKLFKIF